MANTNKNSNKSKEKQENKILEKTEKTDKADELEIDEKITSSTSKKTSKSKTSKSTTKNNSKDENVKNTKGKVTKISATKMPEELANNDDVIISDAIEVQKEIVEKHDEEKMQMVENEVGKDLKKKNKLPKEEQEKIINRIFENICVAIVFMLYLILLILGFKNIQNSVYILDLKVFSFALLVIAIVLFEEAFKKDSGRFCAFGIETLFLSIATMGLLYINIRICTIFSPVAAIISLLFAIYYVAKSIYIYCKMKKKYFMDNMKDIIQKEEKE